MTMRRCAFACVGVLSISALVALSGCATQFFGSAASPIQGRAYVVGQQGNAATVWMCPTDRVQGECQPVVVEEL